jgi:hypothetical protein
MADESAAMMRFGGNDNSIEILLSSKMEMICLSKD